MSKRSDWKQWRKGKRNLKPGYHSAPAFAPHRQPKSDGGRTSRTHGQLAALLRFGVKRELAVAMDGPEARRTLAMLNAQARAKSGFTANIAR
jgi:hypothetical protein